ncbi:MAG TPA: Fur family transcriptional regulator [bacterium]|nr:Fur family transcriptional regulator [bacterium]
MAAERTTARRHDHHHCVQQALVSAEGLCADNGRRLTALRRRVLREVWRGHDAVKAYDILERLGDAERAAKPPTVYRALQFLQEQGLVHRLESLNAFVGCAEPHRSHQGQFLICRQCGAVHEIHVPQIATAVNRLAQQEGFKVERQMVEVLGTCQRCR